MASALNMTLPYCLSIDSVDQLRYTGHARTGVVSMNGLFVQDSPKSRAEMSDSRGKVLLGGILLTYGSNGT